MKSPNKKTPAAVAPKPEAVATIETVQVETNTHPLSDATDAFVASCSAYVAAAQSANATVVGSYRLAFNGTQLISVTHV